MSTASTYSNCPCISIYSSLTGDPKDGSSLPTQVSVPSVYITSS
nr:MAG TPA: hypothetical protein [Caudoviricetes sp.]